MKAKSEIEKAIPVPDGVNKNVYISYLANFGKEFAYYTVKSKKTEEVFLKYYGDTPYKVITNWDINGDGCVDYFAIEEYKKVRRGLRRGIIVDERGEEILFIDTIKGVYTKDYSVVDLKEIGHAPGEVECYSIGFISYMKGKSSTFAVSKDVVNGGFDLQRLDKDLNIIGSGFKNATAQYRFSNMVMLYYSVADKKCFFETQFPGPIREIDEQRRKLKEYRDLKKNGIVFMQPKDIPQKDVDKAIEWVMVQS